MIAGPFYNIIKVMMKGPNKQSNTKKTVETVASQEITLLLVTSLAFAREENATGSYICLGYETNG